MSVILVVAPHPDDETLGCGGTLLRHSAEGNEVHWLIMSAINKEAGFSQERIENRANEINKVAEAYGFVSVKQVDFITELKQKSFTSLIEMMCIATMQKFLMQ